MTVVIRPDRVLRSQIIQFLRKSQPGTIEEDETVGPIRGIVRGFGPGIASFEAQAMARPFLEANQQCVVPGAGSQQRQAFEVVVKLRIWPQEIDQGNSIDWVAITGVRLVENRARSSEERQKRVRNLSAQQLAYRAVIE